MTRQRYSAKESLNRILRTLEGKSLPYDYPDTVSGDVLSESEALSDIAELLEGSLPNEAAYVPEVFDVYGQIWTWTGTAAYSSIPNSGFSKITGAFHNYSNYRGVTPDVTNNSRILITDKGSVFRIDWSISFVGSPDLQYKFEAYANNIGVPQSAASETPKSSGTYASASGFGYQYISGTNIPVDLRVLPSATGWMKPDQLLLGVQRISDRVNLGSNGS